MLRHFVLNRRELLFELGISGFLEIHPTSCGSHREERQAGNQRRVELAQGNLLRQIETARAGEKFPKIQYGGQSFVYVVGHRAPPRSPHYPAQRPHPNYVHGRNLDWAPCLCSAATSGRGGRRRNRASGGVGSRAAGAVDHHSSAAFTAEGGAERRLRDDE